MVVRVGTSGWQYRDWRGPVYRAGLVQVRWLEHYVTLFSTVESNAAFYRLPTRAVFEAWAARTPDDFVMAVKASRYLTHILRLREPGEAVQRIVERASGLGSKLGPVLLQLPPRFPADAGRLEAALDAFPTGWRLAVEVRDSSWDSAAVRRVLQRRDAALCLADRRGPLAPDWRTASWTYLRLHEGRGRPRPCYEEPELRAWARRLCEGWGPAAEAWVYTNNDPRACAPSDALRFAAICRELGMDVARTAEPAATVRPAPDP